MIPSVIRQGVGQGDSRSRSLSLKTIHSHFNGGWRPQNLSDSSRDLPPPPMVIFWQSRRDCVCACLFAGICKFGHNVCSGLVKKTGPMCDFYICSLFMETAFSAFQLLQASCEVNPLLSHPNLLKMESFFHFPLPLFFFRLFSLRYNLYTGKCSS